MAHDTRYNSAVKRTVVQLSIALACLVAASGCGDDGTSVGDIDAAVPDAAVPDADTTLRADYIFDLAELHHFDLELTDADWASLKADPRAEVYVPATLTFEGTRYEGAALRFKGGYGTLESCFDDLDNQICPKLSMRISMNEYGPGRFAGLRKLNFHSGVRDTTLMHEVLGYHLFRSMGVPAPRASHATLSVNGEALGLFILVEHIDKEFVEDHFTNDTGNLYKSVWPQWDTAIPYIEALKTNEAIADVTRMLSLHASIAAATEATFPAAMTGKIDLPAIARYLAVDRAISNDDGPARFYCFGVGETECTNGNYYWYEEPGAPAHLIPWDLDYTLGDVNSDLGRAELAGGSCEPIHICEFYQTDPCDSSEDTFILPSHCDKLYSLLGGATWTDYVQALRELALGPLSRDAIVPLVNSVRAKIRPAVAADPFGPGSLEFESSNLWLDEVIEDQLIAIQAFLNEETP